LRTSSYTFIENPLTFKEQLLGWGQQFREITFLDSNSFSDVYSRFDCVLAVDAFTSIKTDFCNAFEDLKNYQQTSRDWLFGYLSYDLKNDVENVESTNFDGLNFPDLFFFQPKKIFLLKGNRLEMQYLKMCDDEMEEDWQEIIQKTKSKPHTNSILAIKQRISKHRYTDKVTQILKHIQRGDIYEATFCMEFFAKNATINPLDTFLKLNGISQAPFASFFKNNNHFLLSASPERYLKKEGQNLLSQPIKGTAKRFLNPHDDEKAKCNLAQDPKERAENIMITDLVRNDLSRTAQKGSVAVKELCGIYSFLQVHQMISTITSTLKKQHSPVEALATTFPMGSMTGAPKRAALKIIETLEETKRGLYSGSVGYFTPDGDFDFNVVIRSILYNQDNQYLSFSVGSAITALSIVENEYQECLLKAKALFEVLQ
jgi:para-aminobenzoate synthetase component I